MLLLLLCYTKKINLCCIFCTRNCSQFSPINSMALEKNHSIRLRVLAPYERYRLIILIVRCYRLGG